MIQVKEHTVALEFSLWFKGACFTKGDTEWHKRTTKEKTLRIQLLQQGQKKGVNTKNNKEGVDIPK